jgi:hypothetical protein
MPQWVRATRMAAMENFDHILHWKLKQGSHAFPGKDGGTCINEAAIVAAGFPYQPVRSVHDMPKCFSRPICALAMQLNDEASDEERQHLLSFVTRLSCANTPKAEQERETYIAARMRWRLPFQEGMKVLEGALAIGRQAGVSPPDEVRTRMDAVQARATIPTSVPDAPLFGKIKTWFGTKETASAG